MKTTVFLPGIVTESLGIIILVTGFLIGSPGVIVLGAALTCLSVAVHATRIIRHAQTGRGEPGPETKGRSGSSQVQGILYSDRLVTLTGDSITFHHYSFPFFTAGRTVLYRDIVRIEIRKPTVLNGKWRIGGSGNLSTWFPFDGDRPSRDRIFHATIRTRGMNIGFTVENPAAVTAILKQRGVSVSDEVTGPG